MSAGTPTSSSPKKGEKEGPRQALFGRVVLFVVAPLLIAVLMQAFVVRAFKVSSSSMEPLVREGDTVLARRTPANGGNLLRWDVVVLDAEVDPVAGQTADTLLKRVVALGEKDRFVGVKEGDVYIGESPQAMTLARKPDALVEQMLVPVSETTTFEAPWRWDGPGQMERDEGGGVTLIPEKGEPAIVRYSEQILDGGIGMEGQEDVLDTAIEVVVGEGEGIVNLTLREGGDVFQARLSGARRGGAVLQRHGAGVLDRAPEFAGLKSGDVAMAWNVDNEVRVLVNGIRVLGASYESNLAVTEGARLHNGPLIAIELGERRIERVTVLRDVHYTTVGPWNVFAREGAEVRLGMNHLYVLGDNSRRSRDSRFFGPVDKSAVQGRLVSILLPWSRAGWVTRYGGPGGPD